MRYNLFFRQDGSAPMTDFPPCLPHGELREVLPDIFFVTGQVRPDFNGQQFQFSRNMTVVRDGDELTLLNTLRLNDEELTRLEALGRVVNLVKLGAFHGRDDAFYIDRYGAKLWALPGMPHERGVTTDVELVPGQPGPCAGSSVFSFETSSSPEAVLVLEREGGIVVSCDSLHNWSGPDQYFDETSAVMMKNGGFFHPANIGPGWLRGSKPQASDFSRLRELSYRHLLSAHGEPLHDRAREAVNETIDRVFGA